MNFHENRYGSELGPDLEGEEKWFGEKIMGGSKLLFGLERR